MILNVEETIGESFLLTTHTQSLVSRSSPTVTNCSFPKQCRVPERLLLLYTIVIYSSSIIIFL